MQSVKDDSWSFVKRFGSENAESTSSPYINDLKCGRFHHPSNHTLKSDKIQVTHQFPNVSDWWSMGTMQHREIRKKNSSQHKGLI